METRTQQEIIDQIRVIDGERGSDFFGARRGNLVDFLNYEHAKEFLKEGVTEDEWDKTRLVPVRENIVHKIADYMPFAWSKANDKRGLSAARSQDHMESWLWLLNDPVLYEKWDSMAYRYYGKEKLIIICEGVGLDHTQWDDSARENS